MLQVDHADPDLERMETDRDFTAGFEEGIAKRFRYTMQLIRTVSKKKQLYQFNGLRLHPLPPPNSHQDSMSLNKKYRLIVEFSGDEPNETIRIIEINNHYDDN
jgi:plasmid maintenance system killer protein